MNKKMILKDIEFYAVEEKAVKPFGTNGAHVLVPSSWIGNRVKVFLIDNP